MESIHGHEVLELMRGKSFETKEDLKRLIIAEFGENQLFHTCSTDNLSIDELIDFLKEKGKFMTVDNSGFTVDSSKVCQH